MITPSELCKPACGTCRHWEKNAPEGGRCQQTRTLPGALVDYLIYPDMLGWDDPAARPLQTHVDFGCRLHQPAEGQP